MRTRITQFLMTPIVRSMAICLPSVRTRLALAIVLVALVLAAACKSDSAPAGPPTPQSVRLTSDTTPLLLGDSVAWKATVILSNGAVGTGTITWQSSNAAIMTVSAAGVVTAKGSGSATITASGSGLTASKAVRAYAAIAKPELKMASGAFTVTSTSDQIAAGTMTLTRAAGAAPIVAGDVILGTADGGYIRRVTAASGTGATQTLQTVQATVADAFTEIATDTIFTPNVAASLRAAYLKDRGTDRWPAGLIVAPDGSMSLSSVLFSIPIGLTASLTKGAGTAEVALNGKLTFDVPEIDLKVKLKLAEPSKNRFRFVTKLHFGAELTPSMSFTGSIASLLQFPSYEKELVKIPLGTFCGGPLCFKTSLRVIAYAAPFANVTGSLSQKINMDYGVYSGVDYYSGSWHNEKGTFGSGLTANPPVLNVGGSAGLQVGVKPEIETLFEGVAGPFIGIDVNSKAEIGLKNNLFTWFYTVDAGASLVVGGRAEFLGIKLGQFETEVEINDRFPILKDSGAAAGVTMAPASVSLSVGGTQVLTPSVKMLSRFGGLPLPVASSFTCTSANPAIATTTGCTVRGVSGGNTTVTAVSDAEKRMSTIVPVTVVGPVTITPTTFAGTHNVGSSPCPATAIGNLVVNNTSGNPVNITATRTNAALGFGAGSPATWTVNNAPAGANTVVLNFNCATQTSFTDNVTVTVRTLAGVTLNSAVIPVTMTINPALVTISPPSILTQHIRGTACPDIVGTLTITNISSGAISWTAAPGTNGLLINGSSSWSASKSGPGATSAPIAFACAEDKPVSDDITITVRNQSGSIIQVYSIRVNVANLNPGE